MIKFLDLNLNNNKQEIKTEINNIIDKDNYINGQEVKEFEINFAKYLNCKYFIGVGNGTDAIEIALNVLNLSNDSEVIVQGNTYFATTQSVINNNLNLILCDVNKDTHQIDILDFKSKINKKTKVLILVHLYGIVSNMDEIVQICNVNNIILIEDCAQAHGAEFNGKKVGTYGKLSCFSFYPGKNLGAYGDAGGIATNDEELYNKILYKRNNGSIIKYQHDFIGRNSRLDTIQSVVLNIKLKYLDENNLKRKKIVDIYNNNLKNIKQVKIPKEEINTLCVYHLYVIQVESRTELIEFLKNNKIETLIHYPISNCELKALKYLNQYNKNCVELSNNILSLPLYPELQEKQVYYICNKINEFYYNTNYSNLNKYKFDTKVSLDKGGLLHCINNLNFDVKRTFYIDNFNYGDNPRGNHSNISCKEFLYVINGAIKLTLINKNKEKGEINLYKNEGYIIENNIWLIYEAIYDNTILNILCDEEYSLKPKSIYNLDEFFEESKYIYYDDYINKLGDRYNEIISKNLEFDTHSSSCNNINIVLDKLNELYTINENDCILDVGCGEGYCFKYFNKFNFGKIHGIEVCKKTYDKCIYNLEVNFKNNDKFDVLNLSAQEFKNFDDYNYFYFYNPFNSDIFENFIKNINVKNTIIIYYNIHEKEREILEKNNFKFLFKILGLINRFYYIYIKIINDIDK